MNSFYNIRIDGTIKWIFGEDEEQEALETYYWLKEEKPGKRISIERKDTDELGTIKKTYSYIEEYDVWAEDRERRVFNGNILHGQKKFTTRGHVRRER
ncbi:MAG: hypothetical protein E6Z03_01420 [Negativicoccus succinicivorans]|uniref:hypothetical protein n=1 Tax=Negativicoccus succinicivorans TaxID=620903 RepID=UPI00290FC0D3|nr:hypothetical protein [Negativicoccus succinicivorans]MDU5942760.1 hypothetical protein [Negativicoccus succinicivorans]